MAPCPEYVERTNLTQWVILKNKKQTFLVQRSVGSERVVGVVAGIDYDPIHCMKSQKLIKIF